MRMPNERDFVLHSWCVPAEWDAPTVVGGRGARLLLEGGRELLDMSSLVECSNLGHQHPRLVAAIARDLYVEGIDTAAHERFINTPLTAPSAAPYERAVTTS